MQPHQRGCLEMNIRKVIMMDRIEILERERLISTKEVETLTGLSRVTLWRKSNNNTDPFPQAYRNGTHYTRWKLSEILTWIESLKTNTEELA